MAAKQSVEMDRLLQLADINKDHANPTKPDLVLIGYIASEEQDSLSQISYFKDSKAGKSLGCAIEWFPLPSTLEAYKARLESYYERFTVKQLYIIAHGDRNGKVELAPGVLVEPSQLELTQPGPGGNRFTCLLSCFAHRAASMTPYSVVADRQIGRNLSAASQEGVLGGFVWKVPRVLVDGKRGWVNTGLNPDILGNRLVKDVISKILAAE